MNFLCCCPSFPLCMPQGNSKQRDFSTDLTPRRTRQTLRHSATTSACHRRIIKQGERETERDSTQQRSRESARCPFFSHGEPRNLKLHACVQAPPPAGMYACMHLEEAADLKGIGCVIAVL